MLSTRSQVDSLRGDVVGEEIKPTAGGNMLISSIKIPLDIQIRTPIEWTPMDTMADMRWTISMYALSCKFNHDKKFARSEADEMVELLKSHFDDRGIHEDIRCSLFARELGEPEIMMVQDGISGSTYIVSYSTIAQQLVHLKNFVERQLTSALTVNEHSIENMRIRLNG